MPASSVTSCVYLQSEKIQNWKPDLRQKVSNQGRAWCSWRRRKSTHRLRRCQTYLATYWKTHVHCTGVTHNTTIANANVLCDHLLQHCWTELHAFLYNKLFFQIIYLTVREMIYKLLLILFIETVCLLKWSEVKSESGRRVCFNPKRTEKPCALG